MMNFKDAKKEYESVSIPDRLEEVINQSINRAEGIPQKNKKKTRKGRYAFAAALAASVIFVFTINVNTAFAENLSEIPVLKNLIKVVLIDTYTESDKDIAITVRVPSIKEIGEEQTNLPKKVNKEIYEMCSQYADEARDRALEYRKAFLDTGGTEEEWKEHNIQIEVGYTIKNQSNEYLSFIVYGTENWTSAYAQNKYYNIDIKNKKFITLRQLFGDQYVERINKSIKEQIRERSRNEEEVFFTEEEGGFQSISEEQNFYLNSEQQAVIVFEKYEIAPGYMGEVEFVIDN